MRLIFILLLTLGLNMASAQSREYTPDPPPQFQTATSLDSLLQGCEQGHIPFVDQAGDRHTVFVDEATTYFYVVKVGRTWLRVNIAYSQPDGRLVYY